MKILPTSCCILFCICLALGTCPALSADDSTDASQAGDEEMQNKDEDSEKNKKPGWLKPRIIETSDEAAPAENRSVGVQSTPLDAEQQKQIDSFCEPLKKLATAEYVFDISQGGADPYAQLIDKLCKDPAQVKRYLKDLLWMSKNASPAGRIYAAYLVKTQDKVQGERLFDLLKSDKTLVTHKTAAKQVHYTVGEIATNLAGSAPSIKLH